jgi:hypothetical protein
MTQAGLAPPSVAAGPVPGGVTQAGAAPSAPAARGKAGITHAHLVGIKHYVAGLVLQLDNGEEWQEVQPVAGDLSLRVGDAVEIERRLGSSWLSGPHVYGMNVRRR